MFHECRHIKTDGMRCHAAALRGKAWCYFHARLHRLHYANLPDSQKFQLPPIEDSSSVLLAVGQVIRSLNSPYIDCRRAGLLLQALQIAAKLTTRLDAAKPSESVRSLYTLAGAPIDPASDPFETETEILAPDKTVCEPPHDCPHCPRQSTCQNYQEPDEDNESEDNNDEDYSEDDEEPDSDYDPDDDAFEDDDDDDESEEVDDADDPDHEERDGGSSGLQAAESRPTNLKGLQARGIRKHPRDRFRQTRQTPQTRTERPSGSLRTRREQQPQPPEIQFHHLL